MPREKIDARLKIFLIIFTVVIAGGIGAAVWASLNESREVSGADAPKLKLETASFDLGDIPIGGGLVKKQIKITNEGESNLKISKIITSCMCTTASLEVDGKKSPAFGMPGHSSGSLFWSAEIKPRQSGVLEIVYDPAAHGPAGLGPFTRVVTISSNNNGKNGAETEVVFDGTVIK